MPRKGKDERIRKLEEQRARINAEIQRVKDQEERTTEELGQILRDMYDAAQDGEKSAAILLFGIQYATTIGKRARKIVQLAGIGDGNSYTTEVNKGMGLARVLARHDDPALLRLIRGEKPPGRDA